MGAGRYKGEKYMAVYYEKLYHGVAYYPELWCNDVIEEDIRHMKKAGINVVRMGEFAWANMEMHQGDINLELFINIINELHTNGISTVMCTPTVTPPIWMSYGHPERMYVNEQLQVMSHGSREHVCINNEFYRERSRIIVEAVARAVGKLSGVIGWQIHNEFNWPVKECYCENCKRQWHLWLAGRYLTVEKLNEAWATGVWSQSYQRFEQVPQPLPTPYLHNASLTTAYRIFTREKVAEYLNEQIQIIKKFSDAPITTNTNRIFFLDNELMFENLDFAAFDEYADSDNYQEMLMNYDLWRNTKRGIPFWVMETSTAHSGCIMGCPRPHPNGYLTAEVVAAYAMGAQGFCYWLWRQQRSGCEMLHGSVLSSWGKPTLGYKNVLAAEKARKDIEPIILNSKPQQAELAITYSDRARSFFFTETFGEIDYYKNIREWYEIVLSTGLHRDLIFEGSVPEGYRILMSPYMPYISYDYFLRARDFVEKGGIWIIGPLSGCRTGEHTVPVDYALGRLEEFAGVETVYTYPMSSTGAKGSAFGITAKLGLWSALFESRGAVVVGTVNEGLTPGLAFLTEHKVGYGKVVMLGSMPQGEEGKIMLRKMVSHYADEAGITMRSDVSCGTVAIPRINEKGIIWVIVNMDGNGGNVTLPADGIDLISGKRADKGSLNLYPYEYRAITFN